MGLYDGINNPWAPGGQMATRLPWAQPALDHGWGHGNEFFTPKTQEQLHQEAMLQLAILAVALVAPAVLGAGGAAGAQGGIAGAQAVGMGTSAEAAAGAVGQAGVAAAGAGTGSISMSGAMLAGGLSAASSMLQPFLKADSTQVLQQAARVGEGQLNQALHQMSSPRGQQVESEAAPHRLPVNSLQSRIPSLRSGDLPMHAAVPMLVELAEVIGRDRGMQMELRAWRHGRHPSQGLLRLGMEVTTRLGNPWEVAYPSSLIVSHVEKTRLEIVIEEGLKSNRFRQLWNVAGLTLENYEKHIELGNASSTDSQTDKITLKLTGEPYDILALTHELNNRINGSFFRYIDDQVRQNYLSPEDWADAVLGIESQGVVHKYVVAAELGIKMKGSANSTVLAIQQDPSIEALVLEKVRENQHLARNVSTGKLARDEYIQMAINMRERYLLNGGK
jgi:hypothetical protein